MGVAVVSGSLQAQGCVPITEPYRYNPYLVSFWREDVQGANEARRSDFCAKEVRYIQVHRGRNEATDIKDLLGANSTSKASKTIALVDRHTEYPLLGLPRSSNPTSPGCWTTLSLRRLPRHCHCSLENTTPYSKDRDFLRYVTAQRRSKA